MTNRFENIPASKHYPGMIKIRIGQTERAIQVLGWGSEAEKAALSEYNKLKLNIDDE